MALITSPQLSIVLPAYEEAANLENLLPRLAQVAGQLVGPSPQFEILVVDTPTPRDETPAVCQRHGVRYVPRRGGSLYGHAIRTALEEARGQWVIFMDADGSHNPGFLPELWRYRDSFDLVIASRYVPGGKTENPAVLIFLSLTVNVVFRVTLGLKCADVSNSFRLYRGDDLRALRLKCNHFDIVEEILVKLTTFHPGYRLKEVPFFFEKRKAGKTKRNLLTFALGYFVTLLRLLKLKREARAHRD
jgi:dolichol-phosphate mannosyltransferase